MRSRFVVQALGAALCLAVALAPRAARAQVERYAVFIGHNEGNADEVTLQYAERDAEKIAQVLRDLGGFRPENIVMAQGQNARAVRRILLAMNDRIRSTGQARSSRSVLFVYYSGHADATSLHLGGTRLDTAELEQIVRGSAAAFRFLVVDACRSGSLTRVKGGVSAPPFAIRLDDRLQSEGAVFLTSSAANEDSQESDVLRGSFFTHYLVSGLLGAADMNRDGAVSLSEAYRHAYEHTLRASSRTLAGVQHATFRYELAGRGDVVLTRPGASDSGFRAAVSFARGRAYLVFRGDEDGPVVAEVAAEDRVRTLSLRAGTYFVRARGRDHLLEGTVRIERNANTAVRDEDLERVEYARFIRKGLGDRTVLNGIEAGYWFRTPVHEGESLCHGFLGGYSADLEHFSIGVRLGVCRAGFSNDYLDATNDDVDLQLRAMRAFDLPIVTLSIGVGLGAVLISQRFTGRSDAADRLSGAAHISAMAGVLYDFSNGWFFSTDAQLKTYFLSEESSDDEARFVSRAAFQSTISFGLRL